MEDVGGVHIGLYWEWIGCEKPLQVFLKIITAKVAGHIIITLGGVGLV